MKKFVLLLSCFALTGCGPKVGPQNLNIDSDCYNRAVHNSTDRQVLLNMVRLHYRDTPTFLQVGIISSSYDYSRTGTAAFEIGSEADNFKFKPSAGVSYSEKPTATYSPVRGENFVNEFLSPIKFETLVSLNTAGWNMDRILRCCVQRINDVRNAPTASGPTPKYVPDYSKFIELSRILHELVAADQLHLVTQKSWQDNTIEYYLVFDRQTVPQSEMMRVWDLLGLDEGVYEAKITPYHGKKHLPNEIMIQTRSPLSLLYFLSQAVHSPLCDEMEGLVTITRDQFGQPFDWENVLGGIMNIHVAPAGQGCGAVVVHYRGFDYYIDDRDLESKSTFSMLSQLLALQLGTPNIPVVTLPLITP